MKSIFKRKLPKYEFKLVNASNDLVDIGGNNYQTWIDKLTERYQNEGWELAGSIYAYKDGMAIPFKRRIN